MSKQDGAEFAFVSAASAGSAEPSLGPLSRELKRVEEANEAFFDAYRGLDVEAMDAVWLPSAHVRCVHPNWELVVGWTDIRSSWEELFESLEDVELQLEDVHVEVAGRVAWVNQLVYVTLQTADGDVVSGTSIATNLFEHWDGRWRLVLHHASALVEDDEHDETLEDDDDLALGAPPPRSRGGSGEPN